jgi:hypothetical protein
VVVINPKGVKVKFLRDNGEVDFSIEGTYHGSALTTITRPPYSHQGSGCWLSQIWVTETCERLTELQKNALVPTPGIAMGTSGSSLHATLCTDLAKGAGGGPLILHERWVIAIGDDSLPFDPLVPYSAHTLIVSGQDLSKSSDWQDLWHKQQKYFRL